MPYQGFRAKFRANRQGNRVGSENRVLALEGVCRCASMKVIEA